MNVLDQWRKVRKWGCGWKGASCVYQGLTGGPSAEGIKLKAGQTSDRMGSLTYISLIDALVPFPCQLWGIMKALDGVRVLATCIKTDTIHSSSSPQGEPMCGSLHENRCVLFAFHRTGTCISVADPWSLRIGRQCESPGLFSQWKPKLRNVWYFFPTQFNWTSGDPRETKAQTRVIIKHPGLRKPWSSGAGMRKWNRRPRTPGGH